MEVKVEIRGNMDDVNELIQGRKAASVIFALDQHLRGLVKHNQQISEDAREAYRMTRQKISDLCYEYGFGFLG